MQNGIETSHYIYVCIYIYIYIYIYSSYYYTNFSVYIKKLMIGDNVMIGDFKIQNANL